MWACSWLYSLLFASALFLPSFYSAICFASASAAGCCAIWLKFVCHGYRAAYRASTERAIQIIERIVWISQYLFGAVLRKQLQIKSHGSSNSIGKLRSVFRISERADTVSSTWCPTMALWLTFAGRSHGKRLVISTLLTTCVMLIVFCLKMW